MGAWEAGFSRKARCPAGDRQKLRVTIPGEASCLNDDGRLRLGRVVLIASGGLALVLAWSAQDLVFWLVLFAWGGLGAALGPALILSLFWRGATRDGIAAGMVTGTVVTIGWRIWLRDPTGLYELVPGFALAALAIWVVSRAQRSRRS